MFLIEYLFTLILTVILEISVAFLWGLKKTVELRAILLINLLTHPILHLTIWTISYFYPAIVGFGLILLFEIIIILSEWRLLVLILRKKSEHVLILSSLMNITSFVVGILLYGI